MKAEKTSFLAGVKEEAKRITWPNYRELRDSTVVVIAFIVMLSATTLIFDKVIKLFIDVVVGA